MTLSLDPSQSLLRFFQIDGDFFFSVPSCGQLLTQSCDLKIEGKGREEDRVGGERKIEEGGGERERLREMSEGEREELVVEGRGE